MRGKATLFKPLLAQSAEVLEVGILGSIDLDQTLLESFAGPSATTSVAA